ncbi:hypothetical protein [Enterobacter hormaechei]|uniref:hypothetical protein n=1 Tax=Enterobacter hormaechei TaxID=158836 RepID=UPI003F4304A7
MNKQLIRALNKANNMPMTKENFLGLVIMLILSKDVFRTNLDVGEFINKTFKISFLNYVIRSRTLMCAKICRHINELDDNDVKLAHAHFLNIINALDINFDDANKASQKISSKNKHAIRNLNIWINAIKKEKE